ncbi:peptidase M23 [Parageobacillus thermoglucosidasius]|jgi:hypothetical protein|uniref:peptidase M23 n=1 Tax=Parageobacillus thermoglucosidasius TaxID=1426 RepID=UPI000B5536E1|nr:peptidase M23 [Parageobacillus thermoglucosidasius]OUM93616.1 MAG: peptidase M23 [Parageobacillus thermoglucosidasius]
MKITLRTALLVLLYALIVSLQYNLDADKTATRQLKNALELAVHDAALAVDPISLAEEGKIVFLDGEQLPNGRRLDDTAIENFKKSLEMNLNLTSAGGYVYSPKENSFFKNDIYVPYLEFIDDSHPLAQNGYGFTYSNEEFQIDNLKINGPSVVAIIITESPRWFQGEPIYIRQAAVYEYKR